MSLKIHISYKFVEGAWGGGNQFLKALRNYFRKKEVYSENAENADVILFNSYPFGSEYLFNLFFKIKKKSDKILIHRVDGPISYVRGKDEIIDKLIFKTNELFADATIFQSNWSMNKNYEIGMQKSPYEKIIMNAPDPNIFNTKNKKSFGNSKIKLISTSWSNNIRKGFDIYKFLDENLNFNKYEFTFVGNSPIKFKNVKLIKTVPTEKLAKILKEHDIFIIGSKNDPCSNSLIEAMHCGLPAVARNDGGHPEIVGKAGVLFESKRDVIDAIEKVAQNFTYYQKKINVPNLDLIGKEYYKFAQCIYEDYLNRKYCPKKIGFLDSGKFINIKLRALKKRVFG